VAANYYAKLNVPKDYEVREACRNMKFTQRFRKRVVSLRIY